MTEIEENSCSLTHLLRDEHGHIKSILMAGKSVVDGEEVEKEFDFQVLSPAPESEFEVSEIDFRLTSGQVCEPIFCKIQIPTECLDLLGRLAQS